MGRNTPTGVGKTIMVRKQVEMRQKHPHGRGEDIAGTTTIRRAAETPPRAWGRLDFKHVSGFGKGNTPTGVGKTLVDLLH